MFDLRTLTLSYFNFIEQCLSSSFKSILFWQPVMREHTCIFCVMLLSEQLSETITEIDHAPHYCTAKTRDTMEGTTIYGVLALTKKKYNGLIITIAFLSHLI
jgi:hypothetical protein